MKYVIAVISLMSLSAGLAFAAPTKSNNPQIVANFTSGDHGIVGEPFLHQGTDTVMQAGQSGNFQQWFFGTSTEQGVHGDHSVWMSVGTSTQCPNDGILVINANQNWGSYLQPGNYCVRTNDFRPTNP